MTEAINVQHYTENADRKGSIFFYIDFIIFFPTLQQSQCSWAESILEDGHYVQPS